MCDRRHKGHDNVLNQTLSHFADPSLTVTGWGMWLGKMFCFMFIICSNSHMADTVAALLHSGKLELPTGCPRVQSNFDTPFFSDICYRSRLSFHVVNGHSCGFDFLKKKI